MNKQLQQFAHDTIKDGLRKCSKEQQFRFKQMYAGGDFTRSIDAVVDDMPEDKLDWAMEQVENTLAKNARRQQA